MHQHIVLIDPDINREDAPGCRVEGLRVQLRFKCVEYGDYPLGGLWTVLCANNWDSRDREGFAGVGTGSGGLGPGVGVCGEMLKDRAGDSRWSETGSKGALREGMEALSNLRKEDRGGLTLMFGWGGGLSHGGGDGDKRHPANSLVTSRN